MSVGGEVGLLSFGSRSWFEFEQLWFGSAFYTKTVGGGGGDSVSTGCSLKPMDISWLSLLLSCVSPPSASTFSSLFQWRYE